MRYVAYYRVSTARQGRSGLGLEAQRKAISQFINGGGATLLSEFTEVETGKRNDRPELANQATCTKKHTIDKLCLCPGGPASSPSL